jgi:hypothetical protein
MADTDEVEVPMAWFWAEHVAEDLVTQMDSPVPLNAFGFRAASNVLGLTMLFTGIASDADELSIDQLERIRDLVSAGSVWLDWCDARLDDADVPAPCLGFASRALGWLLLASPLSESKLQRSAGAGCRVGLMHALRAVDARLSRRRQ